MKPSAPALRAPAVDLPVADPQRRARRRFGASAARGAAVSTVVLVLLQICYPLAGSGLRAQVTVAVVVVAALTCLLHITATRGPRRAALVLGLTAVPGFLVEVVGVHTGVPFGAYHYSELIGPRVLGVPLTVALAWTMLSWPAALAARRLVDGRVARVVVAAWAMTAGDLFLDPQLVATGAWVWERPGAHLPGVPSVPLTNYVGWFAVSLLLSALVQASMGDGRDALGLGLFLWSWTAWITALAVFLHRPAAAAWGAVAMGTVAVPLVVQCTRRLRAAARSV